MRSASPPGWSISDTRLPTNRWVVDKLCVVCIGYFGEFMLTLIGPNGQLILYCWPHFGVLVFAHYFSLGNAACVCVCSTESVGKTLRTQTHAARWFFCHSILSNFHCHTIVPIRHVPWTACRSAMVGQTIRHRRATTVGFRAEVQQEKLKPNMELQMYTGVRPDKGQSPT